MNTDKIYSVKSNAVRDMKKAIAKGELPEGSTVTVVPTGYMVALPPAPMPAPLVPWVDEPAAAPVRVTPQVPALDGMAPLGAKVLSFNGAVRAVLAGADVETVAAQVAKPAKPAAKPAQVPAAANGNAAMPAPDNAVALLKAVAAVAGPENWVLFETIYQAAAELGLNPRQMPTASGAACRHGFAETAWSNDVGLGKGRKAAIRITAAGFAAQQKVA